MEQTKNRIISETLKSSLVEGAIILLQKDTNLDIFEAKKNQKLDSMIKASNVRIEKLLSLNSKAINHVKVYKSAIEKAQKQNDLKLKELKRKMEI